MGQGDGIVDRRNDRSVREARYEIIGRVIDVDLALHCPGER